ncbi:MAG: CHRD domain-containing protein [Chloroflexota bacterium]|nr:CHRD domain-containing protein [Chloroflexota bacterium]
MRFNRFALTLGLLLGALLLPSASFAQSAHPTFVAEMNGFEEVPGAATLASGFAGLQVGMNDQTVYYTITVTDASAQLVAAHLHFAPHGEAGPVVVPLCTADSKPCQTEGVVTQGSFTAADFTGPFANDSLNRLISEARNGMVYANVHSTKFATGEARGQLVDLGAMMHMIEPAMEEPPMGPMDEPDMQH